MWFKRKDKPAKGVIDLYRVPVQFPLYYVDGSEFHRFGTIKALMHKFEFADLGPGELYDALYRPAIAEPVMSFCPEYKVYVDTTEDAGEAALWFRHSLINFCLSRRELDLANETVFCMETAALIAEICTRLGYQ